MDALIWIIALVVFWALPAYLVARWVSRSKGRSFGWFLVLGLVIGWLVALIVGLIVSDKRTAAPEPTTTSSL